MKDSKLIGCAIFFFFFVAELTTNNKNNCNVMFGVLDDLKATLMLN